MISRKFAVALIAVFSLFVMFSLNIQDVKADIRSVSVTPLVDDSQDPDRFDISGEPGDQKELHLSVTNFGLETLDLRVQPTNATTSPEGKLDFSDKVVAGDYGLKYAFADMTKGKTIRLKKNETKDLTFKVTLPDKQLYGTIIGGLDVYDIKHPNDGHSGVGVYFDTIPADENHKIKFQGITPEVHNQQPYLMVNLANYQAATMKNMIVQVKIKKNNWWNKLGIDNHTDVADVNFSKIAPNSRIPIEFNQKQTPIQPGEYLVEGTAKNGRDTWRFKENVHVEAKAADMVNQASKNLIYDKTGLYVSIIGILAAVIVLVFWGIAYQRR